MKRQWEADTQGLRVSKTNKKKRGRRKKGKKEKEKKREKKRAEGKTASQGRWGPKKRIGFQTQSQEAAGF